VGHFEGSIWAGSQYQTQQGNQEQINRFFGTITDTVPVAEFFSPENIGRIMAAAASPVDAVP
jgi:hypothetical protein